MRRGERRHPVPAPLPPDCRPPSLDEAYRAQAALNERLGGSLGAVCGGRKIGCTTPVMQRYLRIEHPCAGALHASRVFRSPARRHARRALAAGGSSARSRCGSGAPFRRREAPFDRADVAAAVESCMAAIEIVDDRYDDFRALDAASLVADDFFSAGAVLGAPVSAPVSTRSGLDLAALRGTMTINDRRRRLRNRRRRDGTPVRGARVARQPRRRDRPARLSRATWCSRASIVETRWVEPGDDVRVEIREPRRSLRLVRPLNPGVSTQGTGTGAGHPPRRSSPESGAFRGPSRWARPRACSRQ